MGKAQQELQRRCDVLRDRLNDEGFLSNKGLGNEVGIYLFCYDPALELEVRRFVERCAADSDKGRLSCRIVERNLYDVLLRICEDKRILDRIPQQEERRGTEALLGQLQKIASPEAFAAAMDYEPHQSGDVLFITGVGEVYPVLRAHVLLDNIQSIFHDMPIVLFYPGRYNGQALSLFGTLEDGNYYRAFDLI